MGAPNVGQEVIARLVRKLGSVEKAAARLGMRPGLVQRFLDGVTRVPDSLLLKALDLMADDSVPAVKADSAAMPPAPGPARR